MRDTGRARRLGALSVTLCVAMHVAPANAAAPDDPYFVGDVQWGLEKIEAERAWTVSRGRGAIIAVVDTGVDFGHPDLEGRLLEGRDFVDDPQGEADPTDRNGHGTLIAGIIAAATDNGIGVASTAPKAKILPVRVLDENGEGTSSVVARGIGWAVEQGAAVVNLSLAREGSDDGLFLPELLLRDPAVDQAIRDADAAGAVVVVAAGNDDGGGKSETSYDATTPGVLVVGSSTKGDERGAHSNHGSGLDLLAPGGGSPTDPSEAGCTKKNSIVSTWWNPERQESAYGGGCGTSMAVAFVSGVAALLSTQGMANAKIVDRVLVTSDDLGAPGRDDDTGHGRLNARRAVGATLPAPPAPKRLAPQKTRDDTSIAGEADPAPEPPRRSSRKRDSGREPILEIALPSGKPARPVTPAAFMIALVVLGHSWRILAGTRR